jgi:hypothetical protein
LLGERELQVNPLIFILGLVDWWEPAAAREPRWSSLDPIGTDHRELQGVVARRTVSARDQILYNQCLEIYDG